MISRKARRTVVLMLLVAAVLPFLLVDKEVLLSIASPIVWLVGYPVMLAVAISVVAPRAATKGTFLPTSEESRQTETGIKAFEMCNNPIYADQIDNDFHRTYRL